MKPKTVKVFVTYVRTGNHLVSFHLTRPSIGAINYISENDTYVCREVAERLYGGKLPKTFEDGIVIFNIARVK